MLEKIRATISQYNMLTAGDSIVVGVSGGADSVCLLHALLLLRGEFGITVKAAHLNHMLRGDESDRDQAFVQDLCKRLQVELAVEAADVAAIAKSRGISIEEAGRAARYEFFAREKFTGGEAAGGNKVATAHNLNDSVETVLLNLARGTALRGLCGIPPVRGDIIRPLIECERGEIEAYCKKNGLDFVTDSTNLANDFARNKIRHHAVPALLSVNAGFWRHAAGTLAALRQDADFLDALAQTERTELSAEYLALEKPVRYRMLAGMLSDCDIPVDGARLARLNAIVKAGSGAEQLGERYFFRADGHRFGICEVRAATAAFCVPVDIPRAQETREIAVFSNKKLRLMNTDCEYYEENIKYIAKDLKNALNCDRIIGSLVLRQKLPADSVRLIGRNCTKTLRKLFQEKKLTDMERERLFVLADGEGVVWVEGFGAAERAAVTEQTAHILHLEVIENIS